MISADDATADLLRRAQKVVDEAKVSDDLRAAAFAKAFDSLAAVDRAPVAAKANPESRPPSQSSGGDIFDRISAKLQVDRDLVADIYYENDGDLGISVPSSRLARSTTAGARQLALLVAAGRQASGLDEQWTQSEQLREVCQYFGKFDTGNFGKTLASMDDVFQLKGKGVSREVRVKQPGFEQAADLVRSLFTTA